MDNGLRGALDGVSLIRGVYRPEDIGVSRLEDIRIRKGLNDFPVGRSGLVIEPNKADAIITK